MGLAPRLQLVESEWTRRLSGPCQLSLMICDSRHGMAGAIRRNCVRSGQHTPGSRRLCRGALLFSLFQRFVNAAHRILPAPVRPRLYLRHRYQRRIRFRFARLRFQRRHYG